MIEDVIQAFKDQRDAAIKKQQEIWDKITTPFLPSSDPILEWIKREIKSNPQFKEQLLIELNSNEN